MTSQADDDKIVLEPLMSERAAEPNYYDEDGSAQNRPSMMEHMPRERRQSVWDCEPITPMLSRPHFNTRSSYHYNNTRSSSYDDGHGPFRSHSLAPSELEGESFAFHPSMRKSSVVAAMSDGDSARVSGISDGQMIGKHLVSSIVQGRPSLARTSIKDEELELGNPVWVSVVYGMINSTIVLPVVMSFGAIIYRDDAFAPYMPVLVKLTLMSGIVHQICFSTFSSLPFAVGQVQDAGLIFLSGMASNIVQYCHLQGHDEETMLATATVGLSLATTILGVGLVMVGYLRLAEYVQLLPTWYVIVFEI